jgi:hypothetical protein
MEWEEVLLIIKRCKLGVEEEVEEVVVIIIIQMIAHLRMCL